METRCASPPGEHGPAGHLGDQAGELRWLSEVMGKGQGGGMLVEIVCERWDAPKEIELDGAPMIGDLIETADGDGTVVAREWRLHRTNAGVVGLQVRIEIE